MASLKNILVSPDAQLSRQTVTPDFYSANIRVEGLLCRSL